MTLRFASANLDLSGLPAPEVIKGVDYEQILAERLADLVARFKAIGIDLDTTVLESEPAVILEQADAFREALTKAAINDAARSVMLAFATGGNLEHLGAFFGVERLVVTPAADGSPAIMESDADLRSRVQLAPEALPYAGVTGGGYRSLALKTAPALKDVLPLKRTGGRVDIVLLGRDGSGEVQAPVVGLVYAAFQDDAATQLTDIVTVRSATIVPYAANIHLKVRIGPDPAIVRAAAEQSVRKYASDRHRIGRIVYANMMLAAAGVGGVEEVTIDIGDVDPGESGAAYLSALAVTSETVT
jgi:phage-related baseplate assembly protein